MRDLSGSVVRMSQIRDLGVSISIDDFGTGYSSISYLTKLPVDALKIDQSFLRNLQEPEGSLPVVQSIVRLAHSMNLKVVAEGVETAAELALVRVLGCDKVQGHVYGASLSRQATEALLRNLDLPAVLTQTVKTQNPFKGELSHGVVTQVVHQGVQAGRGAAAGARSSHRRSGAGVGGQSQRAAPLAAGVSGVGQATRFRATERSA